MSSIKTAYDHVIDVGCVAVAGGTITLVFLAVVYDVIVRSLGLQPPIGTTAYSEHAMLVLTVVIAPYLVRHHGHVRIEVLLRTLPPRAFAALRLVVACVGAGVCLVVCYYSVLMGYEAWLRGEMDIRAIAVPRWALFAALTVGFGLCAIEFIGHAVRFRREDDEEQRVEGL
ncbi:TRAP transporter small permease [Amorphus sp. MBR-141]